MHVYLLWVCTMCTCDMNCYSHFATSRKACLKLKQILLKAELERARSMGPEWYHWVAETLMTVVTVYLQKSTHPLSCKQCSAVFCGRRKDVLPRPPFKEGLAAQFQGTWPAGRRSDSLESASAAESRLAWNYSLLEADCIQYQGLAISTYHEILSDGHHSLYSSLPSRLKLPLTWVAVQHLPLTNPAPVYS